MLATKTKTKKTVLLLDNATDKIDKIGNILNKSNKNTNSYTHCNNEIKSIARSLIEIRTAKKFPIGKYQILKTVTLGGETLPFENALVKKGYKLKGISYETNKKTLALQELNKPAGIALINGDIMKHVYNGEQVIWFDFTGVLRPNNVNKLLLWICNNPITNDCIFSVTYSLQVRLPNNGNRQLFGDDEKAHDDFIYDMGNYIALYLENDYVKVAPDFSIARYKNTKHSNNMVQFIFDLRKK